MKITIIILIIFSSNLYAQSEIDSLEKVKKELVEERSKINDSIKKIDLKITKIKSIAIKNNHTNTESTIVLKKGAKIKSKPDIFGDILLSLNDEKKVDFRSYSNNYFEVHIGSLSGFVNSIWVVEDEIAKNIIANSDEDALIKKFGEYNYRRIQDGSYWIGMTKEMARLSLGNPDNDNRSVGSWGTHNQWVYKNLTLYFENGILTSWQD